MKPDYPNQCTLNKSFGADGSLPLTEKLRTEPLLNVP